MHLYYHARYFSSALVILLELKFQMGPLGRDKLIFLMRVLLTNKYVSNGLSGCGIIDANVFPMLLKYLQKELAIILESEIMSLFSLNFSLIELLSFDFPMIDLI